MNAHRITGLVILCAATLLAGGGCSGSAEGAGEEHFTDELPIEKLIASYGASSDGKTLKIYAAWIGNGFLKLRGGDSITIDVAGNRTPFKETLEQTQVHYVAEVSPVPENAELVITFARGAERVVAKGTLAPNFEVKSPPSAIHVRELVTIDVDPRPDFSRWLVPLGSTLVHSLEVFGTCVDAGSKKLPACAGPDAPDGGVGPGPCKQGFPFTVDTSSLKLTSPSCTGDVRVRLDSHPTITGEGPNKQKFNGGWEIVQYRTFQAQIGETSR